MSRIRISLVDLIQQCDEEAAEIKIFDSVKKGYLTVECLRFETYNFVISDYYVDDTNIEGCIYIDPDLIDSPTGQIAIKDLVEQPVGFCRFRDSPYWYSRKKDGDRRVSLYICARQPTLVDGPRVLMHSFLKNALIQEGGAVIFDNLSSMQRYCAQNVTVDLEICRQLGFFKKKLDAPNKRGAKGVYTNADLNMKFESWFSLRKREGDITLSIHLREMYSHAGFKTCTDEAYKAEKRFVKAMRMRNL